MNNDDDLKDIIDAKPLPKLTPPAPDDDTILADNFSIKLKIKMSELKDAMKVMHQLTNADTFSSAAALVWYKFDPSKDKKVAGIVSMVTTLYRCTQDGAVEPPVDLDELYTKVNGLSKNVSTPRLNHP